MTTFSQLCPYTIFKLDFRLENHLLELENRQHQTTLTKLRINLHNLRLEADRCRSKSMRQPDKRLCIFCLLQIVEDDIHFLLEYLTHITNSN